MSYCNKFDVYLSFKFLCQTVFAQTKLDENYLAQTFFVHVCACILGKIQPLGIVQHTSLK